MMNSRWTDEVDQEADVYFATLSEREIRRRQDLCSQQIVIAHRERNVTRRENHGRDQKIRSIH